MTIEHSTQNKKQLHSAAKFALETAMKYAPDAEVGISQSKGITVSTRFGETENVEFNTDRSLSITLYGKGKKGSASTNRLSKMDIEATIKAAADILHYTSSDPFSGLGDKDDMAFNAEDLNLYHPTDLNVDKAIAQAKEAERKALSFSKITGSEGGQYYSNHGLHVYGNSLGMLESYASSRHTLSCTVISEQNGNMERNYAYTTARDVKDLVSAERVGIDAAERTLARLGAKRLKTGKTPVIFSRDVAGSLFGHFASAIHGNALYRQSSFLLDSLGDTLFPHWFSIYENPHLKKGLGSAAFDNEGTRTRKQDIVKNGDLMTYLLTNYSARKLGLKTTGHAGGIYNWQFTANAASLDELMKKMDRGLLVTSLMGQGVNMITGDYSRGAAGFWIENGKIQFPVNEITIAGNLKTLFSNLVAVAEDSETRSNIQSGSILIEEMSIAGK